jgi:hypothetical protein
MGSLLLKQDKPYELRVKGMVVTLLQSWSGLLLPFLLCALVGSFIKTLQDPIIQM